MVAAPLQKSREYKTFVAFIDHSCLFEFSAACFGFFNLSESSACHELNYVLQPFLFSIYFYFFASLQLRGYRNLRLTNSELVWGIVANWHGKFNCGREAQNCFLN